MKAHNYRIEKLGPLDDLRHALAIRRAVFIKEQGVSEDEESDGKDQDSSHYLLHLDEVPVATARVRLLGHKKAKIERIAVLKERRGQNLGTKLMEAILADLQQSSDARFIVLSSQMRAVPFYEKLGFNSCGVEYLDAGISHIDMRLVL